MGGLRLVIGGNNNSTAGGGASSVCYCSCCLVEMNSIFFFPTKMYIQFQFINKSPFSRTEGWYG